MDPTTKIAFRKLLETLDEALAQIEIYGDFPTHVKNNLIERRAELSELNKEITDGRVA